MNTFSRPIHGILCSAKHGRHSHASQIASDWHMLVACHDDKTAMQAILNSSLILGLLAYQKVVESCNSQKEEHYNTSEQQPIRVQACWWL